MSPSYVQGDEIRELKKSKPDKATITPHVDDLIKLKAEYKAETGRDYAPPRAAPAAAAKMAASSKEKSAPKQAKKVMGASVLVPFPPR